MHQKESLLLQNDKSGVNLCDFIPVVQAALCVRHFCTNCCCNYVQKCKVNVLSSLNRAANLWCTPACLLSVVGWASVYSIERGGGTNRHSAYNSPQRASRTMFPNFLFFLSVRHVPIATELCNTERNHISKDCQLSISFNFFVVVFVTS